MSRDKITPARSARHLATPSNVRREALSHTTHPGLIWFTLILAWLVSLLPWRIWQGAPDILLLLLVFWCLHEPRRVGLLLAFIAGILMDVHDAGLLGAHAFSYTLTAYGGLLLYRRLQRFGVWVQAIHLLPVFFLGRFVPHLIHAWLAGKWLGWSWVISVLITVFLWPIITWILLLSQREEEIGKSAST